MVRLADNQEVQANRSSNFQISLTGHRGRSMVKNFLPQTICGVVLLVTLRILRRWNQTGQKHAGEPDIAKAFLPAHIFLLWAIVILTYLNIARKISRRAIPWASRLFSTAVALALGAAAIGFKIAFTMADAPELLSGVEILLIGPIKSSSLVNQARGVFWSCLALLILTIGPTIYEKLSTGKTTRSIVLPCHDILTLLLITQTRIINIPTFLLFEIQYLGLDYLKLSIADLSLTFLLLQYTSFFSLGGSNAISSIDLSNAYNGVAGYNVGAVGLLTFLSNWAGPFWWTSAAVLLLTKGRDHVHAKKVNELSIIGYNADSSSPFEQHIASLTFFSSSSALAVMLACTMLRAHLFIWTVFSPKYLYIMAWSIGQHLCTNIGLGSLFAWIASW